MNISDFIDAVRYAVISSGTINSFVLLDSARDITRTTYNKKRIGLDAWSRNYNDSHGRTKHLTFDFPTLPMIAVPTKITSKTTCYNVYITIIDNQNKTCVNCQKTDSVFETQQNVMTYVHYVLNFLNNMYYSKSSGKYENKLVKIKDGMSNYEIKLDDDKKKTKQFLDTLNIDKKVSYIDLTNVFNQTVIGYELKWEICLCERAEILNVHLNNGLTEKCTGC